jgi:hypothetical protein
MSEPQRHQEIRLMEAIVEDYRALAADETPELPMFLETRKAVGV